MLKLTIIGNMGKNVEVKATNDGKRFGRFSLASTATRNKEKVTTWIDVVCWDEKKVEVLEQYTSKGTKLYVEATLEKREYEKDGQKRTAVEAVIGRFSGDLQILSSRESDGAPTQQSDRRPAASSLDDDEMPF